MQHISILSLVLLFAIESRAQLSIPLPSEAPIINSNQDKTREVSLGGISPNSGSITSSNFVASYTEGSNYHNLRWVQILFAVAPDGGGQAFCLIHYDVPGNGLYFYTDSGNFTGPVVPGGASGAFTNSLCAVNTQVSTANGSGGTLALTVKVLFKLPMALKSYTRALNFAEVDTGMVQQGQYQMIQPVWHQTVTPDTPTGSQVTFSLTVDDAPGFEGVPYGWSQFQASTSTSEGDRPFCFVHYDRAGNGLWMYSGDVGFFVGPVAPGVQSNTLNSSACSVNTAGASALNASGSLQLTIPILRKAPMSLENKPFGIYQRTLNAAGADTGWIRTGTWSDPFISPGIHSAGGSTLIPSLPPGQLAPDNLHTWNPIGGAVNNYHLLSASVDNYLQANYNNGQRIVRILLWFKRGGSVPSLFSQVGTVIDSTGGNFPAQTRANLVSILQKIKTIGYAEVLISFGPIGHNYAGPWLDRNGNGELHDYDVDGISTNSFFRPPGCSPDYPTDPEGYGLDTHLYPCHELWRGSAGDNGALWETGPNGNEDYYQENWGVIRNIYPLVVNIPGLQVKVDLGNESYVELDESDAAYDAAGRQILHHRIWGRRAYYMKKLWADFNAAFGRNYTGGFSIATGDIGGDTLAAIDKRVKGAYQIYDLDSVGRPYFVLAHFYDESLWSPENSSTAGQMFQQLHLSLNSVGAISEGVAIGEAYWNDALTADFINEKASLGRTVYYLLQWPYVRYNPGLYLFLPQCPLPSGCFVQRNGGVMDFSKYTARGF